MRPVILTPWLCMKVTTFMMMLLIPSPKSPGKDIDVYLKPLIDDLIELWKRTNVKTIDTVIGYMTCTTCNKHTTSERVLSKTTYVGHRIFLNKKHKWTKSLGFNGQTEDIDPPRNFTRKDILTQLDLLPTREKGKHPSYGGVKIKRNPIVELNLSKRSIFYELKYWSFLTLKHNLDVMHIEKNVLESFLGTLLMNDKSKDTTKARQDLKALGI
ncbi:hypothetical protein Tco_0600090 [Tanacetum coccineum]|uniref:Uncharacterized protein n=1 Tax=Tanacetum coccineum TaxID=301880 RepID=A0ABQ4WAV0_9ASTR